MAPDPAYVESFVESCLESIGEDDPDEGEFLRGIWEDGHDWEFVLETLKSWCEVRTGIPRPTATYIL